MGSKYEESTGGLISRIMDQLANMDVVGNKELDIGSKNPEGVCGWLVKRRKI